VEQLNPEARKTDAKQHEQKCFQRIDGLKSHPPLYKEDKKSPRWI
jgi:hypothetical protein